ncbi:hypothetical protein [Mobilicoccus pelagius]|uniref:Lipoprotein n=1 Tax=Mobilicoccus pelagius NBRC 104925 TaxID=1089455 RepID=H5UMZ8_9MICO|nr:hypothetical protein [Mobilicoccus pelagius]GAB47106.1 hypothetical protein MOPEL_003_01310 [Mobilicoccus pelagius NBRC 104925]
MKRSFCALVLALPLALGACGTAADKEAANQQSSKDTAATSQSSGDSTPATGATSGSTPTDPSQQVGPSRTAGAPVIGADQGKVEVTGCKAGKNGVDITAKITNTTKEKRSYIATVMVYDGDKKVAGSAAVMADAIPAGETAEATGASNKPVKGNVTCDVAQIDSMPMS